MNGRFDVERDVGGSAVFCFFFPFFFSFFLSFLYLEESDGNEVWIGAVRCFDAGYASLSRILQWGVFKGLTMSGE